MRRLGVALAVVLLAAGCTLPGPAPPPTPTSTTPTSTTPATPTPPLLEPRFDGERAMAHVRAQVLDADGTPIYRVPGTEGNQRVAGYIVDEMRALGYDAWLHPFTARYGCENVAMHNVVAARNGTSGRIVAFAAHYDTRPVADKDPDPERRDEPILGANDGASGVGVLLELARVLPATNDTLRFLFFDGEDGGGGWSGCETDWILGSRAYAASLSAEELARFDALVLVDMVGAHDLRLPKEGNTAGHPRARIVQDEIYLVAERLGHEQFVDERSVQITDDHVPFLERDVPAVDLIHLEPIIRNVFPSWHHTHEDDLDIVSAESLDAVGETVEAWFAAR